MAMAIWIQHCLRNVCYTTYFFNLLSNIIYCGGGVPPPPMATSHDDAESNFESDDTLAGLQEDTNTE